MGGNHSLTNIKPKPATQLLRLDFFCSRSAVAVVREF